MARAQRVVGKRSQERDRPDLRRAEVERGRAPELTGYQERAARLVVAHLLEAGLLVSTNHRAPLRLGFPIDVVERWFPRLYPVS